MEPIYGFMLYVFCAAIIAAIAGKKGLTWWAYLIGILVAGPVSVMGLSIATQATATGFQAACFAFLFPAGAFLYVLFAPNAQGLATKKGEFGEYKKCYACAEPVRIEAIKCKHCGSSLEASGTPGATGG
jgi:hypothetical protein